MPVFFDVKSHSFRTRDGKTANFFLEDKNYEAIFFSIDVFLQYWSFQSNVGMPVWLAWFERVGAVVRPERMLVCPLSVVSRFWMPISSLKWHFIQIPIRCCHSIDVKAGDPLAYKIDEREIEKHVSALRRYAEERY